MCPSSMFRVFLVDSVPSHLHKIDVNYLLTPFSSVLLGRGHPTPRLVELIKNCS